MRMMPARVSFLTAIPLTCCISLFNFRQLKIDDRISRDPLGNAKIHTALLVLFAVHGFLQHFLKVFRNLLVPKRQEIVHTKSQVRDLGFIDD